MRPKNAKKIPFALSALATAAVLGGTLGACSAKPSDTNASLAAGATSAAAKAATSAVPATTTATATTTPVPTTTTSTRTPAATTATAVSPVAAVAPAAPAGVPCQITNGACASLSMRKAWLIRNGQVIFGPVSIMPGSRSYPTPTGMFHVLSKEVRHLSREFDNAPMPYSVFFYPGDAFHVGSLGVYSHGCIHLSWSSAEEFFRVLSVGDPVQIVG